MKLILVKDLKMDLIIVYGKQVHQMVEGVQGSLPMEFVEELMQTLEQIYLEWIELQVEHSLQIT